MDLLDETFRPIFGSNSSCEVTKLTMDVKSKRSRSSPSLSLLFRDQTSNTSLNDHEPAAGSDSAKKQHSTSSILVPVHKNTDKSQSADLLDNKEKKLPQKITSLNKDDQAPTKQLPLMKNSSDEGMTALVIVENNNNKSSENHEVSPADKNLSFNGTKNSVIPETEVIQRLSMCLEESHHTLQLPHLDNDEGSGGTSEELDLLEPWEDLSSTKQWVTSPLHSPDVEELFKQLSPFSACGEPPSSVDNNRQSVISSTEHHSGNISQSTSNKPNLTYQPSVPMRGSSYPNNAAGKSSTPKQKNTGSSQRFYRQMSYEAASFEKREENYSSKHRPYSLNLDTGHRCIRDISNQQNQNSSELSSGQRVLLTSSGTPNNGLTSDLELFLSDRQAPLRRNSAPVSVSSVRTAFMIKTCQAKAVPVIPPRVQYSQIPHSRHEKDLDVERQQEKDHAKMNAEKSNTVPPPVMSDLKEELENKEPTPKHQKHPNVEKCAESARTASIPEQPVITRRQAPTLEVFVDCPRPNRGNLLQRPSFRNRQRPQSLILLSPPFPIMDYPPSLDDSKLKSLNDASAVTAFSKEVAENYKAPEGITLQNKMTLPKSGQRLETSTSCFYQPQRRSMIFESRSQRQIE